MQPVHRQCLGLVLKLGMDLRLHRSGVAHRTRPWRERSNRRELIRDLRLNLLQRLSQHSSVRTDAYEMGIARVVRSVKRPTVRSVEPRALQRSSVGPRMDTALLGAARHAASVALRAGTHQGREVQDHPREKAARLARHSALRCILSGDGV
jgi:hypothetical protein